MIEKLFLNRERPMARILWLNWSGGGNLLPQASASRGVLTIERGHQSDIRRATTGNGIAAGEDRGLPRYRNHGRLQAKVDCYPQGHFMTRARHAISPACGRMAMKADRIGGESLAPP